jgi:lysophospholipase L1-like esterase
VPGRPKAPDPKAVQALNAEIRSWVGSERATLVDSFAAFDPAKELLIGQDGLHPTVDGYKKLAEVFFDAITTHFEAPPPAAPSPSAPAGTAARSTSSWKIGR